MLKNFIRFGAILFLLFNSTARAENFLPSEAQRKAIRKEFVDNEIKNYDLGENTDASKAYAELRQKELIELEKLALNPIDDSALKKLKELHDQRYVMLAGKTGRSLNFLSFGGVYENYISDFTSNDYVYTQNLLFFGKEEEKKKPADINRIKAFQDKVFNSIQKTYQPRPITEKGSLTDLLNCAKAVGAIRTADAKNNVFMFYNSDNKNSTLYWLTPNSIHSQKIDAKSFAECSSHEKYDNINNIYALRISLPMRPSFQIGLTHNTEDNALTYGFGNSAPSTPGEGSKIGKLCEFKGHDDLNDQTREMLETAIMKKISQMPEYYEASKERVRMAFESASSQKYIDTEFAEKLIPGSTANSQSYINRLEMCEKSGNPKIKEASNAQTMKFIKGRLMDPSHPRKNRMIN
jgi:hypothetical protein